MDPDKLTIVQISSALRPRHVVSIITALAAVAGFSYWLGHEFSANSSAKDLIESQTEKGNLEATLREKDNELKRSQDAILGLVRNRDELQNHALSQAQQINDLVKKVEIGNTCSFVQGQIESLQAQVASIRRGPAARVIVVGSQAGVLSSDEKETITDIEQRIARFQQQLAGCAGHV